MVMPMDSLLLFIGKSASGKTTIANILEAEYGHKQVESYCTRAPRYPGERGHVFVTEEEFKNLGELAAYTFYNNNHYGTTFQQLDECSIYVIDIPGLEILLEKLPNNYRPIRIMYFDAAVRTRIMRMVERHSSDHEIISRLLVDDTTDDWYEALSDIAWYSKDIRDQDVALYKINANENIENVLEQVLYYINQHEEREWFVLNVVLYSTHCPKCKVLSAKLQQKNINYTEVNDVDLMQSKGLTVVPVLEVDGVVYDFKKAVEWIGAQ